MRIYAMVSVRSRSDGRAMYKDGMADRMTTMTFSLHTDRPGELGERPENEISYPEYQRVRFDQVSGSWEPSPAFAKKSMAGLFKTVVSFPECHAGGGVGRFWAACSLAEELLLVGVLGPPIHVSPGVTPQVHLTSIDEIVRTIEVAQRGIVSHVDRVALQAIRGVVADAVGHPARDAALSAIDRLVGGPR